MLHRWLAPLMAGLGTRSSTIRFRDLQSAVFAPASHSCSTATIRASVNRLVFLTELADVP